MLMKIQPLSPGPEFQISCYLVRNIFLKPHIKNKPLLNMNSFIWFARCSLLRRSKLIKPKHTTLWNGEFERFGSEAYVVIPAGDICLLSQIRIFPPFPLEKRKDDHHYIGSESSICHAMPCHTMQRQL